MLVSMKLVLGRQAWVSCTPSGCCSQGPHPVGPGEAHAGHSQSLRDQLIRVAEVGGHDAFDAGSGQDLEVN